MPELPFQFDLYRLNIVDDETYFEFVGKPIANDDQVRFILRTATSAEFDQDVSTKKSVLRWSLREFVEHDEDVIGLTLARSIRERTGRTVTEEGIEEAVSELSPPLADMIHILFRMDRHLVAVEVLSDLTESDSWRAAFHSIVDAAAAHTEFRSSVRLEPVPREDEILSAFRSFTRLTRLRVHLRLPNPEMYHLTERLRAEMQLGGIRDYLQDMRNAKGLSRSTEALPFMTVAMAQSGYKSGEVVMEGIRKNRRARVRTGRRAARGTVEGIRDFVRGLNTTLRTKEARTAIAAIMEEIDRVAEPPTDAS